MGYEKILTEIITCDNCDKKVEKWWDLIYLSYRAYFNNTANDKVIELGLCEDCAKVFNNFVRHEDKKIRNIISLENCKFKHIILE